MGVDLEKAQVLFLDAVSQNCHDDFIRLFCSEEILL